MDVQTVSTTDQSLLGALRSTLSGADAALLCVAFVHSRGVRLVEKELSVLGDRTRLVVTTTFDQTNGHALAHASALGTRIKTLNPGAGSTYHPKLYLARHGRTVRALVGSANLTGGLATNVELAISMQGTASEPSLVGLGDWAEAIWSDARTRDWHPTTAAEPDTDDALAPELLAAIDQARRWDPVFRTLGPSPRPNLVAHVTRSEVLVETQRTRGELSNKVLLGHLRVHRSSAVCAILARVPGVTVAPGRGITLRYQAPRPMP